MMPADRVVVITATADKGIRFLITSSVGILANWVATPSIVGLWFPATD